MNAYIFSGLPDKTKYLAVRQIKESNPELIIKAVCETFGLTPEILTGPERKRIHTEPRQIAIALILHANPKMTLKQIGKMFNRDHSTVVYSREVYNDLIENNAEFQKKVALVKQKV
jgi:chromosomal replication initiator protein